MVAMKAVKNVSQSMIIWFTLVMVLLSLALNNAPTNEQRRLFSDQSSHIMAAMSVWHDFDLNYTLDDLHRFREVVPAEPGPRGLFLKIGKSGVYHYSKPFLYAVFASPFYGFFGINGFVVFNALCFFLIGAVSIKSLNAHFGLNFSLIITAFFMIFSPFLPWMSVPHPDLFVASLLALGGYLVLKNVPTKMPVLIIGGCLLGFSLFEKPSFIFIMPFLFIAMPNLHWKLKVALVLAFFTAWIVPTLVNIFQDGNVFSYQGSRFTVPGPRFPLEEGNVVTLKTGTGHVFNMVFLLQSLIGNLGLFTEKLYDFFFGRQTGILIYFPTAFALLIWIGILNNKRSRWVLVGFFLFMILNWLAFPTNGYGGSDTYGSRYILQILPLLILASLVCDVKGKNYISMSTKLRYALYGVVVIALLLSVIMQYKVLPPGGNLVQSSGSYLNSYPAKLFPIEKSLLPTIASVMPNGFYEVHPAGFDHIYRTVGFSPDNNYLLKLEKGQNHSELVLYQFGLSRSPAPIEVKSFSSKVRLSVLKKGELLWSGAVDPGVPTKLDFDKFGENFFNASYFDFLSLRNIRWESLELRFDVDEENSSSPGYAVINFSKDTRSKMFKSFGQFLRPQDFNLVGILTEYAWSSLEGWGVWTNGPYAELSFLLEKDIDAINLKFVVKGYIVPEHPAQLVDVMIKGKIIASWNFSGSGSFEERILSLTRQEWGGGSEVKIGFLVHNPVSPNELQRGADKRKLGMGLQGILIDKVTY